MKECFNHTYYYFLSSSSTSDNYINALILRQVCGLIHFLPGSILEILSSPVGKV